MVLCVVSGGCAHARDYHVSPDGDDANPGTAAKPWGTTAKVNGTDFGPGDPLLFEGRKTFAGTVILDKKDSGLPDKRGELRSMVGMTGGWSRIRLRTMAAGTSGPMRSPRRGEAEHRGLLQALARRHVACIAAQAKGCSMERWGMAEVSL